MAGMAEDLRPLCGRPLSAVNIDRHHLVPKSLKGREQFPIHKICHRKIHATFSERELPRAYRTWDALQADADIQAFIACSLPNRHRSRRTIRLKTRHFS